MKKLAITTLMFATLFAFPCVSSERADHFQATPSPTLAAALDNIATYNPQLQKLLEKRSLTAADLNSIHELTYTLEQALARIGEEQRLAAEQLEEVHLASERGDVATVKRSGDAYVKATTPLIR